MNLSIPQLQPYSFILTKSIKIWVSVELSNKKSAVEFDNDGGGINGDDCIRFDCMMLL